MCTTGKHRVGVAVLGLLAAGMLLLPAAGRSGPDGIVGPFAPQFVSIPAGAFIMGSPASEPLSKVDEAQHKVTLTHAFRLAATEVSQGLWRAVTGENPSYFAFCDSCPVERVSWLDAVRFCNVYSEREGLATAYAITGQDVRRIPGSDGFRLPTEAEWEYACRAGSVAAYFSGTCLNPAQGNYNGYHPLGQCPAGMNRGETIEAGRLIANRWGLWDMAGNVAEWCWDVYGDYPAGPVVDPTGPAAGQTAAQRVFRGGSYLNFAPKCRSANREALPPDLGFDIIGLRLARSGNN